MSAQATISVRLDQSDKHYFEEFCRAAGLNVSAAINIFVKEVVREQRIPFAIKGDPFYSEENMERIREALAEVKAGHYTVHDLIEVYDK